MTGAASAETGPVRVLVTGPATSGRRASGVKQHVIQLAQAFVGDSEFEVAPFAITDGEYVEPWLRKGLRLAGAYLRLPAAASGAGIVHINSTIDDRSIFRDSGVTYLCRLVGRPVVWQFHGGGLHRLRRMRSGLGGWFARGALTRTRALLFLSEEQATPVAQAFGITHTRLVSNYVEVVPLDPVGPSRDGTLQVLYMGRLNETKGVLETIEAFGAARRDGWELVVAGTGPDESRVRAAVEATPGAQFRGFVEGEAKRELLAWADVFVLPSDHDEGVPYGVLEAQAAQTAVIASARGGLAQVVHDRENGLIVAPRDVAAVADALRTLADDPEMLAAMRNSGYAMTAEHHSVPAMRSAFAAIWREALGPGREEARG